MAGPTIGTVGGKSNPGQTANVDQSFSFSGSQRTNDAHGRYTDLAARLRIFMAANQAGAAVTTLNATATGFILANDNLAVNWGALLNVGFIQTSTATTTANAGVSLAAGVASTTNVTHTTPLTVRSGATYAAGGTLKADSSSTLPAAPVTIMQLWQPSVSATATTGIPPATNFDIGGLLILQPGTSLSLGALSALSGAGSMIWEEFPVPTNYA